MLVNIEVKCRYCGQIEPARKHGRGKTGFPRYFCRNCQRTFQLDYRYNGHKLETKDKIIAMAMNGSGVKDTMRVLKISINTVISTLKKLVPKQITKRIDVGQKIIIEVDEQWSCVGNKKRQHWLWYALDTMKKRVVAHVFGPRTDETC